MYIQKLDDGSVLLTAPVMIPGVPDCDYSRGEPLLTTEQIQFFAKSHEKYQFVDDEHMLTRGGQRIGDPETSFILESDKSYELFDGTTETYPRGTWMLTSHLTEEKAIQKALNGEYSGYSPTVRPRDVADEFLENYQTALKSQDNTDIALKSFSRSGLIRDVPDPVVLSVSLTKKPCQTHSKFCKFKQDGENMSENDSKTLAKIRKILSGSDDSDVEALKSQMDDFDDKLDEIKTENAEALKSMKEEIISDVKDALTEAFADKKQKDPDEDPTDEPEDDDEQPEGDNSEDETNDNPEEDDEDSSEDEPEKEPKKTSGSKQGKNHNNKSDKSQSDDEDTYEFLGRRPDGTRKQYSY